MSRLKGTGLIAASAFLALIVPVFAANPSLPAKLPTLLEDSCYDCHDDLMREGGLDLTALSWQPEDPANRERWIRIHDRVRKGEMPPDEADLPPAMRQVLVSSLGEVLYQVDHAEVIAHGRGPMRRLNREEYEQNLRDILRLPDLDIRDMLPGDREGHHFNKTAETLDMSRVQLSAYLDASESALQQALASGVKPPPVTHFRALATQLFKEANTFGNREAMFYAKDGKYAGIDGRRLREIRKSGEHDPEVEMALFRSAHWPYYGYPDGFVAKLPGAYRVRFSARSVLQQKGFVLQPGIAPVPMTFRARKPSGPDVSGDVRATGGILDIQPDVAEYETVIHLLPGETFEYSLLGLPVPLARNVDGGPPTYRYPPFPEGGQPGVAFQWLEVGGPISPDEWPPPSHRVLFGELVIQPTAKGSRLPVEVLSDDPTADSRRLLKRFVRRAARGPIPRETLARLEGLVQARMESGATFTEAMLAGYQAFLCSGQFLYLPEPEGEADYEAIASRLSHFLTNTRPDARLQKLAKAGQLREASVLQTEAIRLIDGDGFNRFVRNFTDYWLNLRHVKRDEPDIRLHPEYRFDDYLVESMERETRIFVTAMIRENWPATSLVDGDFLYANDRLSRFYGLPALQGSDLRRVNVPAGSPRGGLLTQAALLKVTANGTTTSPVVRGAWMMERLLGQPPPPPPASVPAVEPDIRGAKTIRQLLDLHTKSKSCSSCHAKFDPVGLALENFDILGGWRERYRGLEEGEHITGIDRAGHDFAYTLAEPVDPTGRMEDGREFADIHELKAILLSDPRQLARNLLLQFTIYATGTPVRFSDRPEIEAMLDACEPDGYRVRDLMLALVCSKIFLGPAGSY